MPNFLEFNTLGWRDAVDVIVVAIVAYYILLALRGTRAVPILYGIVFLLGVQALSFMLKLQSTYFVVRGLVLSIVVALPIVFQPELRRALMHLGGSLKAPFHHVRQDVLVKIVGEISWAAQLLAQTQTGALIVIERETGLEEYIETGVAIHAEVSMKLLLSLFQKTSPLHDGAVILRGETVIAAACTLPLSEIRLAPGNRHSGTRHRAALGLTEQTDAVVVVVSEETGDLSIARGGILSTCDSEQTLKKWLVEYLSPAGTANGAPTQGLSGLRQVGVRIDALMPWRKRADATKVLPPLDATESRVRETRILERPEPVRTVPSESLDEDLIAEKQLQTQKAVELRTSEARRREEKRKDDELRKPEGEETEPTLRPPTAGHASPSAPRTEDSLQGRQ